MALAQDGLRSQKIQPATHSEKMTNLRPDGQWTDPKTGLRHILQVVNSSPITHEETFFGDIMRTGNFNPFPGAMEDELFVTDLGDALRVADQPALIDAAAVVKTSVPGDVYDLLGHSNTIDTWSINNATVIVPSNLLDLFNSTKETVVHAF